MEHTYEVKSPGGQVTRVKAKNSQQAKRKACKIWGRKPSDDWTGIPALKARKIAEDEGGKICTD